MDKLLELIDNIIAYLLYGGEEELHTHKQLRKIWKELRNRQLRYVDKKGHKLLPAFASRVLQLYRQVQSLQELLSLGEQREELLEDERLLEYLITSRLDEASGVDRSTFTYDRLRERIAPLEEQEREWNKLEKELAQFLGQFNSERFFDFNRSCFGLEQLYALLKFNFTSLLGQFASSQGAQVSTLNPTFVATSADQVEQELLDLYFIIEGFEVSPSLRALTEDVLHYIRKGSDANVQVLRETMDQLELLLDNELSPPTLKGLIRLIRQDPYFEPASMKPSRNYLNEYAAKLRERYGYNRERLQRELLHEQVELKVEKIFGEQELLSLEGYNREQDQFLAEHNFPCFSHLHPLEIIKSYAQWKLKKGLLGALKKVAEDGYFEDRNFRIHYEDAVKRAERINEDIEQFEQFMHGRGGLSIEDVRGMIERGGIKGREAQTIQRFVEEANAQAKKLVEKSTNIIYALYREVETVLADYKSNNPKHVSNIRVIGGERNSDMMQKIKSGRAELGELLDVLRKYAVIYKEEQREQEQ
jgi:hypothetical protein